MECVGLGEPLDRGAGNAGAAPDLLDAGKGQGAPRYRDLRAVDIGKPADLPEPKPHRQVTPLSALERAIPMAVVDRHRAHLDAMLARVGDDLGRRIEAHRLGIEQSRAEYVGVVMLHPAAGISDLGERGGVAFGEAVAAEPLDLLECALGEVPGIAARDHPADQFVVEMADAPGQLERRHRAAQLVGFGRREPGTDDRDLHRLLLEQRHAQGLLEYRTQFGLGIFRLFLALAPTQIGMDHIALDGPWPHDRDLDHEVVEFRRLHPRQHRHLRTAFDLEDAERVGLLDHPVDVGIVVLEIGHPDRDALVLFQQIEGAVHAAEHAEAQHVDLHELQRIDVVLVPFDNLAIDHARRLDRYEIVEPRLGQHEPAWMLGEMARRPDQLAGEAQGQLEPMVLRVEVEARDLLVGDALHRPAPDQPGQHLGEIARQPQRLADFGDRATGPIAGDDRRERRTLATVGLIDPLDDLLAPLMLEIDIDIGRLLAFAAHEPLEQEFVLDRVDRGDAKQITDAAVRGRSAALAQNAPAPAFGDDRVHGQEVGCIAELVDETELVPDLIGIGLGDTDGEFRGGRLRGQRGERLLCGSPGHDLLVGILILDLAQIEPAHRRNVGTGLDRVGESGEPALHLGRRLEGPVHEPLAPVAQRVDRGLLADRGDHVLQRSAFGRMIENIPGGDRAQAILRCHGRQLVQPDRVVGPAAKGQGAKAARAEDVGDVGHLAAGNRVRPIGQQDRDQTVGMVRDVGPAEDTAAFAAAGLADREQTSQPAPRGPIGRVEQQGMAFRGLGPRSRDHAHAGRLLTVPSAHDTGNRTPIGETERPMPEQLGGGEQLLGAAGASQEREMARHLQFDIARHQPNIPCMYQLRSPVPASTPSPRRNSQKRSPPSTSTRK